MSFSGRPKAWDNDDVPAWVSPGDLVISGKIKAWDQGHQDQAPPVPNDGPSMHDLVIADIMSRPVSWDLSYGKASRLRDQVADDLLARKQHGLNLYGSLLQAHNGRDALRDAYEEAQDLAVYLRQCLLEVPETSLEWTVLAEVYDDAVTALVRLVRVRLARSGTH